MNYRKNMFALLIAGTLLTACGGGGTDISGGSSDTGSSTGGTTSGSSGTGTTVTAGVAKYIVAATPSPAFQPLINSASSKITFTVTDVASNPVANKKVNVAFSSSVPNGYSLSTEQFTTDSSGQGSVYISAGTSPSTVYVKATLNDDSSVSTLSSSVSFGMGVPDSDSFSVAASVYSLDSAADTDGVSTEITVYAGDKFNHAALDGTKIYAQSNGGQIHGVSSSSGATPFCTTSAGSCTLTLVSSKPRPSNGIVSVIFYTDGEESFNDQNNDGIMNASEFDPNAFTDVNEPYLDLDLSGDYTDGDKYWDLDNSGGYSVADGKYRGLACDENLITAAYCVLGTTKIWDRRDFAFSSVNDMVSVLERWNGSAWVESSVIDPTETTYYRVLLASKDNDDGALMALPSNSTFTVTSTNGGTPVFGKPSGYIADYINTSDESSYALANLSAISLKTIGNLSNSYPVNLINPFYFYFQVPLETQNNGQKTGDLTIQVTSPSSKLGNPIVYTVNDAG